MDKIANLLQGITAGNTKDIAKAITLVENEGEGHARLLRHLPVSHQAQVVGITGPPGAGKSTLVNALLHQWTMAHKKTAVLSVDPSSPFNYGALLGDRIRMSDFYLHPDVFIRSLASRGSLGGLNAKMIEIIDVVRAAPFDYILIETVGVGQSEVEIAGIADTTLVVVVPESGDEVQTMKAGVMEIADIFVVNKADRPNADEFVKNLSLLAHTKATAAWEIPVVKCVATTQEGMDRLVSKIEEHRHLMGLSVQKQKQLLAEKAYQLIQEKRMKDVDKAELYKALLHTGPDMNLYQWIDAHY